MEEYNILLRMLCDWVVAGGTNGGRYSTGRGQWKIADISGIM